MPDQHMAPLGATYFSLDDPRLARHLRGKLVERRNILAEQLVKGGAEDWADYKHRIGVIAGLTEAIAISETAENELEHR